MTQGVFTQKIWELRGHNGPFGILSDQAVYYAIFTTTYQAHFSFEGKHVFVESGFPYEHVIESLCKELKCKEVEFGDEPIDKNNVEILFTKTIYPDEQDYPKLEGIVDDYLSGIRSRILFIGEEQDLFTVNGYHWLLYAVCMEEYLRKGESVDPAILTQTKNAYLNEYMNIVLLGMEEFDLTKVAMEVSKRSKREVVFIENTDLVGESIMKMEGKILVCHEDIVKRQSLLYPLAQNGKLYFISCPLTKLEGDIPYGTKESRLKNYLGDFRDFCDCTYEMQTSIYGAAYDICRDFTSNPYTRRRSLG